MRPNSMNRAPLLALALLVGSSAAATAQLANASTAATGLSGAYTARARGYNAVAWNPANLAMPDNPGFSLTLLSLDGAAGLKPIDLSDLAEYEGGMTVPQTVREQWMLDVAASGGERGSMGGGLTALAFNVGRLGFQFNTKLATDANLPPDVVEALLFGNKGRYAAVGSGTAQTLNVDQATMQGAVYSTGAVALGLPLARLIPLSNFSAGITGKYTVGHGIAMAKGTGSATGDADVNMTFGSIVADSASLETGNIGSGVGIDLGAAWTVPGFRFGVSMQNVMNTFKWDTTKLAFREARIVGTANASPEATVDSLDQAYGLAPAVLREKVAAQRFKPVFAAGISMDWLPKITLSADFRQQVGDGIEVGPKSMVAAGAEVRWIPFIPLRVGGALMDGGAAVSGGLGIRLLGFETGVAGFVRKRDDGTESGVTISAFSIRP